MLPIDPRAQGAFSCGIALRVKNSRVIVLMLDHWHLPLVSFFFPNNRVPSRSLNSLRILSNS
jgi:hypothetical protein